MGVSSGGAAESLVVSCVIRVRGGVPKTSLVTGVVGVAAAPGVESNVQGGSDHQGQDLELIRPEKRCDLYQGSLLDKHC